MNVRKSVRLPSAAVVVLACAVGSPASASARSGVTVADASAKRLRMCGAVHQASSTASGARVVAVIRRRPRATRTLEISRCEKGRWIRLKSVRVRTDRVRLPVLPAGGYRITGPRLPAIYLRVARPAGAPEYPLLDRSTVRAPMVAFCDGADGKGPHRADGTALPEDLRKLVTADLAGSGRAAYFNAPWIPVRDAPGMRPAPVQYPKSCGEFRRAAAAGKDFLYGRQMFQILGTTKAYENLWRVWGLSAKPADFDEQVRLRYGLSEAPFRNPYPRPGEDPVGAGGGSGQLPLGLIQGIDEATGKYNGKLTIACAACHDSILGRGKDSLGFAPGRGSDAFDASLFAIELLRAGAMIGDPPDPGGLALDAAPYPYAAVRGLTNAFGLVD